MELSPIIVLTDVDVKWLGDNFPSLQLTQEGKMFILEGLLGFDLFYDAGKQQLFYNPPAEYHSSKYYLKDVYKVQIKFERNGESLFPQVREFGGEFEGFSRKSGIPLIDLHIQPNGTLCLCPRQEEKRIMPNGLNLDVLFNQLIIPFFYNQSFYKKFKERPWQDYSHGSLGTLEYYFRSKILNDESLVMATLETLEEEQKSTEFYSLCFKNIKKIKKFPCPCGSRKKFLDCHSQAAEGLQKLKSEADYFRIELI